MSKKNGMKKMPLSKLKELVAIGSARKVDSTPLNSEQIGYSMGAFGLSGALFKSTINGKLMVLFN